MEKFYNLKTFSREYGDLTISKYIVTWPFSYAEQNGYLKFSSDDFEKKFAWGGA